MRDECNIIGKYNAVQRCFMLQKIIEFFSNIEHNDYDGKQQNGYHKGGQEFFGNI